MDPGCAGCCGGCAGGAGEEEPICDGRRGAWVRGSAAALIFLLPTILGIAGASVAGGTGPRELFGALLGVALGMGIASGCVRVFHGVLARVEAGR